MDVKNNVNGGGPKVPKLGNEYPTGTWIAVALLGAGVLGSMIYQSGYHAGCDTANKILRRHDKDEKRLKKDFKKRWKDFKEEWVP